MTPPGLSTQAPSIVPFLARTYAILIPVIVTMAAEFSRLVATGLIAPAEACTPNSFYTWQSNP